MIDRVDDPPSTPSSASPESDRDRNGGPGFVSTFAAITLANLNAVASVVCLRVWWLIGAGRLSLAPGDPDRNARIGSALAVGGALFGLVAIIGFAWFVWSIRRRLRAPRRA